MLVGATGVLHGAAIARTVGMSFHERTGSLDPIEADGIFDCELSGSMNKYRLKPAPWTPALKNLIDAIVASDPWLGSLVASARALTAFSPGHRTAHERTGIVR